MLDCIIDALIDSLKLLPFLFITYLLMEYLEDKLEDKSRAVLKRAGHSGPVWGSILGVVPQCGFSAAASSLYAGRVITMGTLIAVFLSTSDEMLPIFISQAVAPAKIIIILLLKALVGIIVGFAIDLTARVLLKKPEREVDIHHFCEHEHCSCINVHSHHNSGHEHEEHEDHEEDHEGNILLHILKPALVHTVKIVAFIFAISVVLNIIVDNIGIEAISHSVLNMPVVGEIVCGLIGLIPNCGASVAITSLYLDGVISFGAMMSGLLVGAGVGILILLKVNDDRRENAVIIGILYVTGVIFGIIFNMLGLA